MKEDFEKFVARKTTIAVVAPHGAEKVAEYWKREGLPMIGIPDEEGRLARLYGQEWNLLKLGRMPALFVVDRNGGLAFAHYGTDMSDIPENGDMLKVLDALKGE